jgi:hypothetical protein
MPIVFHAAKEPVNCVGKALHGGLQQDESVGKLLDNAFQAV